MSPWENEVSDDLFITVDDKVTTKGARFFAMFDELRCGEVAEVAANGAGHDGKQTAVANLLMLGGLSVIIVDLPLDGHAQLGAIGGESLPGFGREDAALDSELVAVAD